MLNCYEAGTLYNSISSENIKDSHVSVAPQEKKELLCTFHYDPEPVLFYALRSSAFKIDSFLKGWTG